MPNEMRTKLSKAATKFKANLDHEILERARNVLQIEPFPDTASAAPGTAGRLHSYSPVILRDFRFPFETLHFSCFYR